MRKTEAGRRDARLTIVFTSQERHALERAARKEHSTISAVARRKLFVGPGAIPVEDDPEPAPDPKKRRI